MNAVNPVFFGPAPQTSDGAAKASGPGGEGTATQDVFLRILNRLFLAAPRQAPGGKARGMDLCAQEEALPEAADPDEEAKNAGGSIVAALMPLLMQVQEMPAENAPDAKAGDLPAIDANTAQAPAVPERRTAGAGFFTENTGPAFQTAETKANEPPAGKVFPPPFAESPGEVSDASQIVSVSEANPSIPGKTDPIIEGAASGVNAAAAAAENPAERKSPVRFPDKAGIEKAEVKASPEPTLRLHETGGRAVERVPARQKTGSEQSESLPEHEKISVRKTGQSEAADAVSAGAKVPGQFTRTAEKGSPPEERKPVTQILDAVAENLGKGSANFKLKLCPEGLGELSILMSCKKGRVELTIIASAAETGRLLEEQAPELRTAMADKNLELAGLQIRSENAAGFGFANGGGGDSGSPAWRQEGPGGHAFYPPREISAERSDFGFLGVPRQYGRLDYTV